ncbi:MAG TPA: hypothetical protein VGA84_14270 [Thermoanaerobaculia bacterium]
MLDVRVKRPLIRLSAPSPPQKTAGEKGSRRNGVSAIPRSVREMRAEKRGEEGSRRNGLPTISLSV